MPRQMSAMCSAAVADPGVRAALKAKGYTGEETFEHEGKTIDLSDVGMVYEESYRKHRDEFLPRCGVKDKVNRKLQKQYQSAVEDDTKKTFGISGWTIVFAVVLGILGGPGGFILAVVACFFEYYFTKDLENNQKVSMMMASV